VAKVILGMIGLGTVGTGVVRLVSQQKNLSLKKIAVKDKAKPRDVKLTAELTDKVEEVINDPEIEILIEVMGGEYPAFDYLKQAISKRKHIVTANKEVLAKHGPELFQLAKEKGVAIFFEASVAGGIPLISTMQKGLEANEVSSVMGILNGTTNFILSSMEQDNMSYGEALSQAQKLGFAEADPTADVDGFDVAYKLSILSALAYGKFAEPKAIFKTGIRELSLKDICDGHEFGYRLKLVGLTRKSLNGHPGLSVRVHPMFVPLTHPLASVSKASNGILVNGHAVGEIIMFGPGAGQMPTASAIVGDTINLASALKLPDFASYFQPTISPQWAEVQDPGDFECPFYLRLNVADHPGVIGTLGTICGANKINIQSIIQRGTADDGASIVIITNNVSNAHMEKAIAELSKCEFMRKVESCIRIFKPAS
jgi:homoserine dehydrogenase